MWNTSAFGQSPVRGVMFASQNPDRVERNADATETLLHDKVVYLVDRTPRERRNANDLNNRT